METKRRREVEVYESYWKFTAAHLDITGTKFNNCLNIIINFIDDNKTAIEENAKMNKKFATCDLYTNLQHKIVLLSDFKGKNATLSARKVINQFVKIGFIYPFLLGYHPLVKSFVKEEREEKKKIIFSKIFYENSSLVSNVTADNRDLKHVAFLLKTLDKSGPLTKQDITALMVTNITQYKKGYLTREELESQYRYAVINGFKERKYNQIEHLTRYLKRFVDLVYDKRKEEFWFKDDLEVTDLDFDETYARDGVKHRIYKDELKEESRQLYGAVVCYCTKIKYKSLIASHIKPCVDCLKEHREDQAYDVNNGLLLNPLIDSYFDKKDISFTDDGEILFGKNVDERVRQEFKDYCLDLAILNDNRKEYLQYHRRLFEEKNRGQKCGI